MLIRKCTILCEKMLDLCTVILFLATLIVIIPILNWIVRTIIPIGKLRACLSVITRKFK